MSHHIVNNYSTTTITLLPAPPFIRRRRRQSSRNSHGHLSFLILVSILLQLSSLVPFVLGITNFHTFSSIRHRSLSSNPPLTDRDILLQLYFVTGGDKWTRSRNWIDPNTSLCDWEGISCSSSKKVEEISLSQNNLSGEIPMTYLLQLSSLKMLKLDGNAVTFPDRIMDEEVWDGNEGGIISSLEYLDLSGTNLYTLDGILGGNGAGTSVSFATLSKASFDDCQLQISFPSLLLEIATLEELSMNRNNLSGPLPSFDNLSLLKSLSLSHNQLTGAIPVLQTPRLQFLFLGYNDFHGPINPDSFASLSELIELSLPNVGFSGQLPSFSTLSDLRSLDLSHNSLTGVIPPDFLSKNYLKKINLGANELEGSLTAAPFSRFPRGSFYLFDNKISAIDDSLCDSHLDIPCDAVLCAPGSYREGYGRQETTSDGCLACDGGAKYYGATECVVGDTAVPTKRPTMPPPAVDKAREILEVLFVAAGGDGWTRKENWKSPSSVCEWEGVSCIDPSNDATISKLYLVNNNLVGSIPKDIYELTSLTSLYLSGNDVTMTFDGIASLTNLQVLDLSNCGLTSMEGLSKATNLLELHVQNNNLKGPIPNHLYTLDQLTYLDLQYNAFTGIISDDISQLKQLQTLDLNNNQIRGSLPSSLYSCSQLVTINVQHNLLTGSIPSFLDKMTTLQEIDLSYNQLGGELPSLEHLTKLQRLNLNNNDLIGTIPSPFLPPIQSISSLTSSLRSNQLEGSIPVTLSYYDINLVDNKFIQIPGFYCQTGLPSSLFDVYKCSASVCPIGTYNDDGRQRYGDKPCLSCPDAPYLGMTQCPPPTPTNTDSSPTASPLPLSTPGSDQVSERSILERLYLTCGGDKWTESDGWMNPSVDICEWTGIRCTSQKKVLELTLRSNGLVGTLPPQIFSLEELQLVNLDGNTLHVDFSSVLRFSSKLLSLDLSHLDLTSVAGLERATSLTELYLSANSLKGTFPSEIESLVNLRRLSVAQNQLTGALPSFERFTMLEFLSAHNNEFEGGLPQELGPSILFLMLQGNRFSGGIPDGFLNLKQLWFLNVSSQKGEGLTGPLPPFLGFESLRRLDVSRNALTGLIPPDFLRDTRSDGFEYVDLSRNKLSGTVPNILASMPVVDIYLAGNEFTKVSENMCMRGRQFILGETNNCDAVLCPVGTWNERGRMEEVGKPCEVCYEEDVNDFMGNVHCGGEVTLAPTTAPIDDGSQVSERNILKQLYKDCGGNGWYRKDGWENFQGSHCQWFGVTCKSTGAGLMVDSIMLSSNNLMGMPPTNLFDLEQLETLVLDDNRILFNFTNIEKAISLKVLELSSTAIFSIEGVEKATNLIELRLDDCNFHGPIPPQLSSLIRLEQLSIDDNEFSGTIPYTFLSSLKNLRLLSASRNFLTGTIPPTIDQLQNLISINLQHNSLSGTIPTQLASLPQLSFVDLSQQATLGNGFTGPLSSWNTLPELRKLDLSHNKLTGSIPPDFLKQSSTHYLKHVDLSSNSLTGSLPASIAPLVETIQPNFVDNRFSAIDPTVCQSNQQYQCDGILCPKGTCNCKGRQIDDSSPCHPCPTAQFMGSSHCQSPPPTRAPVVQNPPPTKAFTPVGIPTREPRPDPVSGAPETTLDERGILIKFYEGLGGSRWRFDTHWKSSKSVCEWYGIYCAPNSDNVMKIVLTMNNLRGTLPHEVFQLEQLTALSLYGNPLYSFPFYGVEYAKRLEVLELDYTGIHSVWGVQKAPKLKVLTLTRNEFNEFPSEVVQIATLEVLTLAYNNITGTVPNYLPNNLNNLRTLILKANRMTGGLTTSLPGSIRKLDLSHNRLTGPIPPLFLQTTSDRGDALDIDLSNNQLTGIVPSTLKNLISLNITLADNYFTGIDGVLCNRVHWNGGDVKEWRCDGILCPRGYYGKDTGRAHSNKFCRPCATAKYYGASSCRDDYGAESAQYERISLVLACISLILVFLLFCMNLVDYGSGDDDDDSRTASALLLI